MLHGRILHAVRIWQVEMILKSGGLMCGFKIISSRSQFTPYISNRLNHLKPPGDNELRFLVSCLLVLAGGGVSGDAVFAHEGDTSPPPVFIPSEFAGVSKAPHDVATEV